LSDYEIPWMVGHFYFQEEKQDQLTREGNSSKKGEIFENIPTNQIPYFSQDDETVPSSSSSQSYSLQNGGVSTNQSTRLNAKNDAKNIENNQNNINTILRRTSK
jgi:hypothetical protein